VGALLLEPCLQPCLLWFFFLWVSLFAWPAQTMIRLFLLPTIAGVSGAHHHKKSVGWDGVSYFLPWIMIPLIAGFQAARIAGTSHWCPAMLCLLFESLIYWCFEIFENSNTKCKY
jgi:hypothetical protein